MKPSRPALAAALLSLLATRASAQLEVGTPAPRPPFTEWIQREPVALESLDGRLIVYAFVRLESDDNLFWLEDFDALRDRFALDPVTFLAVTNESPEYVRETLTKERVGTPFVIDPGDDAAKAFEIQLHPTVAVVSPAGTVAFLGAPGTPQQIGDAIVEQLDAARPFPELPKGAAAITRLLDRWELKKADEALDKALAKAKDDDEDRQRLEDTKVLIGDLTANLARAAETSIEAEDWPRAVVALTRLAEEHEGLPGAEDAAARLAALREDPDRGVEIAAAVDFAKAKRHERDRNWRAAVKAYEALAKVHPDTQAGRRAKELAAFFAARAKR